MFIGGMNRGPLGNPFGGKLFDKGPNLVEAVEMLFKDVETEGEKEGYNRASREYGKVYKEIEDEYKMTKALIEQQKNSHNEKVNVLIEKLELLKKQKTELQQQVNAKANDLSKKYGIPVGDVTKSLANGTLLVGGTYTVDVLYIVYKYKEKKLRDAEKRGYAAAKELYENKIQKLRDNLKVLKNKGNKELQDLLDLIDDVLKAISEEKMKIAELKVLL